MLTGEEFQRAHLGNFDERDQQIVSESWTGLYHFQRWWWWSDLARHRVKPDFRDARYFGRLLRLGESTTVTVPPVKQEATRDLVWAREDSRENLMAARHRLLTRLLRPGIGDCDTTSVDSKY